MNVNLSPVNWKLEVAPLLILNNDIKRVLGRRVSLAALLSQSGGTFHYLLKYSWKHEILNISNLFSIHYLLSLFFLLARHS